MKLKALIPLSFLMMIAISSCLMKVEIGIELSKEELIIEDNDTITFSMIAKGLPLCAFKIEKSPDWLNIISVEKTEKENEVEFTLSTFIDHTFFGIIDEELWVSSCLGRIVIPLQLRISSNLAYSISDTIFFMACEDILPLEIENLGAVPIEYDFSLPDHIYSSAPLSGSFATGNSFQLQLFIDRSGIQDSVLNTEVHVSINGFLDTVPIQIESVLNNHFFIDEAIIDAEYNRRKDIMVMVSSNEPALLKYDLNTNALLHMDLNFEPTCITIAPDGNTAAVGHEGMISHIDLQNMTIIKEFPTSFIAFDMVLSRANWAYVTPKYGQWTTLRCFDLDEAEPIEHEHLQYEPIYQFSRIRLRPQEDFVYTFCGSFMDKFDISKGVAKHVLNASELNHYSGGDAWFAREGFKFYCRNMNVLSYSNMSLMGTIPVEEDNVVNSPSIRGLEHNSLRNEIYIIAWTHSEEFYRPVIYFHDAKQLTYKSSYSLQKFHDCSSGGSGNLYNADPRFVFANNEEDLLMVLSRSYDDKHNYRWFIEMIPLL